jgi:ATP-dependent helicase/nuclease subunit A
MQRFLSVSAGLPLREGERAMSGAPRSVTANGVRRAIVLDPEQQAAIVEPGNVVVRAGAGSGKTEVLARRFVALVAGDRAGRAPLDPAALAAVTFTEKAALDLRQRIGAVLAERLATEEVAGAGTAERRIHLTRARRTLALARISTIHAFCARILRENPFAAGLDPDFAVLDEYESGTFFERVCRETLIEAVRASDPGAQFLLRARRLNESTNREGAVEIVQRLLIEARRAGHTADWIVAQTEASTRATITGARVAGHAEQLAGLIDRLLDTGNAKPGALEDLGQLWLTARPAVLALDESATPEAIGVLREVRAALPDARSAKLRRLIKEVRTLVDLTTTNFGLGGLIVTAWGEYRGAARASMVARIVAQVGAAFDRAKADDRVLTFDDLLIGARDLLRDYPEVAARYRDELRAILVDEYQDTNALQDEIVATLTAPAADDEHPAPELFIVGDEKQSIYRFRGADVRVFNLPRTPAPRHLPLTGNRRSTPNILHFVNGLGAVAMRPREDDPCPPYRIAWRPEHALTARRATTLDYPVEIIAAIDNADDARSGVRLRAGEKRRREACAIANRIRRLVAGDEPIIDPLTGAPRPVAYRDIVVLFRAFPDIASYEDALTAAAIPCYTVQGRGFYGRREVIDLVALLAAVDDPRDSLRLAAAIRSPFFALSDNCLLELGLRLRERGLTPHFTSLAAMFAAGSPDFAWLGAERDQVERAWSVLRELRESRAHLALPAMVERALDLTDYESVMAGLDHGRQRIANLRKVVELAQRFDTRRFFTFHDFVAYLRQLTEAEPYEPQAQILGETDNVVRLMTIHQAKGLEFPVVILADTGRRPNQENRSPLLDPENGVLIRDTDGSGNDEIPHAALDAYRDRVRDEEDAEAARIFYVALTRARDRLIVSEGAGTAGWSVHLRSFIGADAWSRLAAMGDPSLELECHGARVVLRKPDCTAPDVPAPATTVAAQPRDGELDQITRHRLAFSVGTEGDVMISPTALADFARCPRQYWLRHGLGLPERSLRQADGEGDTAALGLVAHAILERVRFGAEAGRLTAEIAELAERLGGAAGLAPDQRKMIARDLSRYAAATRASETIIGREIPFMLNPAPGLFVRGQIDLIAHAGDRLIVRDYKYATAADARRYQLQMECYALAAITALDGAPVVAQIAALRENPEVIDVPLPAPDTIRARLGALGEELASARRDHTYPRKPPDAAACHALGCGYVARCWGH